jgi:hypothetical protein
MFNTLKTLTAAAALLALLFVSTRANADQFAPPAGHFSDGNKLYELCTSSNAGDQLYCKGYVSAVADASAWWHPWDHLTRSCAPAGVTLQQMIDIASRYLAAHPEWRQVDGADLVSGSFFEAFPCPK